MALKTVDMNQLSNASSSNSSSSNSAASGLGKQMPNKMSRRSPDESPKRPAHSFSQVGVFCGAGSGVSRRYSEAAEAMGRELGKRKLGLVYGGGSVGLMGIVARTARDHGCSIVGVIPDILTTRELMGNKIGELIVVKTMHERKALMASMADAFVALPGGFGTLDELFEVITWSQLGLHAKPIGLLNVDGFFDALLAYIDQCIAQGFIRPHHRNLFVVDTDPSRLLDQLGVYEAPPSLIEPDGLDRV